MLRFWSSTVLLLLCLQRVCASGSSRCETLEGKCDFVCDCSDCSDEQNCGYSGKSFECDFEDEGVCGWKIESVGEEYKWQRVQSGDELPESGPTSDYTTGTATGWFMSVSAVGAESLQSSVLISPEIKGSSPTCRLRLRYFLWDSGLTGLGPVPLWASIIYQDSPEAVVWRPETSSTRSWREATIFLGRISSPFRIHLHSARSAGQNGDVAIDQLEFLDCALPSGPAGSSCPAGMVACGGGGGGCVEQRQVCDGTDDCGDGSDEAPCDGYNRCDFEEDLCDWDLRSLSRLRWIRTNQENISRTDPWKGPGRDHSNNTASGYFLYVTVPDGDLTMDWAAFQSPRLQPTNSSHPCKMVMYTHQFGPRSGGLTVLVADRLIYPVWERGGALGDLWVKAEVEIVSNHTFQILIMAAIRDLDYGGIAVDSIVLSPECRRSSENTTLEKFPNPPKNPCIDDPEKMCDFQADCDAAEDEAKCGDFSYPGGSSGWTDTSIGSQGWLLDKNSTTGEFLYVAEAAGQQLTEAQIRTPLLGPTGPACSLSFDFALTGSLDHIGELSVRVIDSLLGVRPKLWEFSGKTGAGGEEETWQHVDVPIGVRKHRFQLAFEARAVSVQPFPWIKVRNVHFTSCHAGYIPSLPTGVSCIFEDGLCAWYQDNSDNFDWSVVTGMDHSIGVGTSLVVDMWSPSLRGAFGRLLSFPQQPTPTESCLTFYYKLYGPNAGTLNVKLTDGLGYEILLWTRSGAHGNEWHEAHCPVPQQNSNFQLMFEAVRSGFDGQVAIDDVAFLDGPCAMPRKCSFEGQKCGYSSYGAINWLHRNGHTTTTNGPRTDHTLGTELGYYMMVNTDAGILPPGSAAVLISPVQQGTTRPECLGFWYHMTGGNPAFFTVYVKPQKGERVPIFSENLNEGDDWRHVNGNISIGLVPWQLEFEVVGSGSRGSHVAVDDITVSAHPCGDQGSKCSLENGMCSWINIQDREREKLDWELTSPEKEKHYPVPPEDHTLGTEKGHFLFFPSSNRTAANQNAWLVSPQLPPIKPTCLRFWAYKPQSSDCQLRVWSLSGGIIYQQLIVNELSGQWRQFELNITSREGYQIVFEGIKGTSGFVALDDIEYTVGFDCATGVTKPMREAAANQVHPKQILVTPSLNASKPDNAGGIAASVIVVVLLIGTLVALLVFYLRTKPDANSPSLAIGISNEGYVPEDPVTVPPRENHPMAAGFNNVSISAEVRKREEEEE